MNVTEKCGGRREFGVQITLKMVTWYFKNVIEADGIFPVYRAEKIEI